jgi:hypothetical protein
LRTCLEGLAASGDRVVLLLVLGRADDLAGRKAHAMVGEPLGSRKVFTPMMGSSPSCFSVS